MSTENQEAKSAPGSVGWNEVVTSDKEKSIKFYTEVMGWTIEEMEMPGGNSYTMFKNGEVPVAGLVVPPSDPDTECDAPEMWLTYINVEDLDATVAKAKEAGAAVYKERVDIPMGSFALLCDSQGAKLAFWQSAEGGCESS